MSYNMPQEHLLYHTINCNCIYILHFKKRSKAEKKRRRQVKSRSRWRKRQQAISDQKEAAYNLAGVQSWERSIREEDFEAEQKSRKEKNEKESNKWHNRYLTHSLESRFLHLKHLCLIPFPPLF